jgi:hypothetical protein
MTRISVVVGALMLTTLTASAMATYRTPWNRNHRPAPTTIVVPVVGDFQANWNVSY